jgi:RHS repeat-associated protein
VAAYHLDAWGNFRFPTELEASRNRFAFTGHIYDSETGLYNAKARYFDPKLGRFLTQDSFLGNHDNPPSLHRYLYGYANPLRYVDPTGHQSIPTGVPDADAFLRDVVETGYGYSKGVVKRIGEGIVGAGITFARATQNLQRPEDRMPGLEPIGEQDLAAMQEAAEFYSTTLSNLPETAPAALDAITELGVERAGEVIGGTTVDVVGAVEGGRALATGTVRAVRAAPAELGEVGANLARTFKQGGAPEAAVVVEQGATGPFGPFLPERGVGRTYQIGDRLPNGRIAGEGPGAALGSGRHLSAPVKQQQVRRMRSGNDFNRARTFDYPHREVYVENPKGGPHYRLDSYDPIRGEIVSRKNTQFARIKERTGKGYVRELARKYPPGARIADVPSSGPAPPQGLKGQRLSGQMYLEVPVQRQPIPQAVLDTARRKGIVIRDVFGNVY